MKRFISLLTFVLVITLTFTMVFSAPVLAATYKVQKGDNLWLISQKFGTGPIALMKANRLKTTMLYPGQNLQVPDQYTHFVNYGDTLWKIAQKHNVSTTDLVKYNGIKNSNNLTVGQVVKIPKQNSNSTAKGGTNAKVEKLIQAGLKYLGRPYQFGASSSQTRTFDCSSFTQRAYADIGIKIKRSSRSQYSYPPGRLIKKSELRRGDLVFFDYTRDGRIDHVAIYYGNNKLLHTYRPKGVEVGPFNQYWHTRYVAAKRIIE